MKPKKEISNATMSRRRFLGTTGTLGMIITAGTFAPRFLVGKSLDESPLDLAQITAWVQLTKDGKITIYNPAAEMGQGTMTALAVIIAEEMDADWKQVHIENAPVIPEIYGMQWSGKPGGPMITAGSRTIRSYYAHMRQAGAQARYVLLHNAARTWGVPQAELSTEPGVVIHTRTNRSITYGEIASSISLPESIPHIPDHDLKAPDRFRLIGKVVPRFDIANKVNGSAQYAMDVMLPDMLYGVVSRSPVFGSKPTLLNEKEVREAAGVVELVELGHGIGVVAKTLYEALGAKAKLQIRWSDGAKAADFDSEAIYETYHRILGEGKPDRELINTGNVAEALGSAATVYDQEYRNDFVYHARMEPMNAVVALGADGQSAEAWAGTQAPDADRDAIAKVLGLDPTRVKFHNCYLGGGFGGRQLEFSAEAAALAKQVRRPVKLIWTREDDVQYGSFRPTSLQRMQAGVDQEGTLVALRHAIVGPDERLQGGGAPLPYYKISNHQATLRVMDHGVRTVYWRSVAHGPNKFAQEAFLDEIARDQKIDPYQFRRRLMTDFPRYLTILDKVAAMAEWETASAQGRAKGMAFCDMGGSFAAAVVEISVDRSTGKIRVHRVWSAFDAGVVVLPDSATAQMEGGIVMGISSVLQERITFKQGKVQQTNFHNYPILRMGDTPETIEVFRIPSSAPPTSMGELSLPLMGGAIANAFLKLTGKAMRHMPFAPEKVLAVLRA